MAAVLMVLLLGADYALYPVAPVQGPVPDRGENGLWLRYTWYFGRRSDAEVRELGRRLQEDRIAYAFFHVRHIQADGTLRYRRREEARRLLRLFRSAAPGVRAVAWIYAGNNGMGGLPVVPLADPAVRARMVAEARWLIRECGFDGVQWDYEVCRDNDPDLLSLLRETRRALGAETTAGTRPPRLSVATPLWTPRPFRRWGWSEQYFSRVGAQCDQIAVMGYDSGLYLPRAYAWLLKEQVRRVPRAAAAGNPECRVLLGVPTYARGGASHHAWAENITVALKAARSAASEDGALAGVALFADYTTQPEEWRAYRRLWLGR